MALVRGFSHCVVAFMLFIIFLLGFLLDWTEITLIIMPLMLPVNLSLDLPIDAFGCIEIHQWFALRFLLL